MPRSRKFTTIIQFIQNLAQMLSIIHFHICFIYQLMLVSEIGKENKNIRIIVFGIQII